MKLAPRLLWAATAVLAVVCVVLVVSRSHAPAPLETAKAPALSALAPAAPDPGPSEWIAGHFAYPMSPQGPAPAGWSAIETSLDAKSCGACHVQQYLDWKESWHAGAMGPGVAGQLVETPDASAEAKEALATLTGKCRRCHAPLAEQAEDDSLEAEAITCAACHVREWVRHGPPKADPVANAPHGGFVPHEEFQDGRFCATCHDFKPGQKSLEGKLLQETWQEWLRTPYARDGVSCQDCHMEKGRHLWKGVHDPEMVKRAFTASAAWERKGERVVGDLQVTNTGAGHRLPTYTTPQLTLRVEQLDSGGAPIPGTEAEGAIARYVTPNLKEEVFDTRLLPGESHTLAYDQPLAPGAASIRATVECWPDEGYRRFYTIEAKDLERPPEGRAALEVALARTVSSRFIAWQETTPIP